MSDPLLFALAVLALLAVPGPTNTLLAAAGATRGVQASLPLLLGELAGYAIAITVYRNLLGAALARVAHADEILKTIVAVYLLWLGLRLWRSTPTDVRWPLTLRSLFVTTLLNPKAIVFGLVIFPPPPTAMLGYLLAFCALASSVGAIWIGAGWVTTYALSERYRQVPPRVCAVVLAVFAILLVSSTVPR